MTGLIHPPNEKNRAQNAHERFYRHFILIQIYELIACVICVAEYAPSIERFENVPNFLKL